MVCSELWRYQVRRAQQGKRLRWFFLVFEEAHNYFFQNCFRSTEFAELVQILTGGRNYKIRFEAITQFASMIDKNAMRYMKQRYFGYSDEPNDLDYIAGFLGEQSKQLDNLKAGEFLYKYGREVRQVYNEIYESKTKPKPYLVLLGEPEVKAEPQEQAELEINKLQVASAIFQIASLLLFLLVCAVTFLSW
jgi:hypothetical protein